MRDISSERLTEDNLKKLDDKIAKEADTRDRREMILEDRKSSVFHQIRNSSNNPLQLNNYLPHPD